MKFSPAHNWVYFPHMQLGEEAILIKTFDSAKDGRARYSIDDAR